MAHTTLTPTPTRAPGIILADATDDYLFEARKLQPTTHRWYTIKLKAFQMWCHANGITTMVRVTAGEVRRFLDAQTALRSLRTGTLLAAQTHHGTTQAIKQFLRWCEREDYCPRDLYDRIKLPKVEHRVFHTLTQEHIKALFAASEEEAHPTIITRDRALLALLLATGVRAGAGRTSRS